MGQSLNTHVFISYSHADSDFIARFIPDLQNAGINVWIDQQGLRPGTRNWEDALRQAISTASAILLIASPSSRRSNYVQDELAIAEMYRRPIYPVWSVGDQWIDCIPMGMGKIQFIDARDEAYNAAITSITDILSKPSPSSTPEPDHFTPPLSNFEPRNPFKGLRSFREDDKGDFFGRDALVDDFVSTIVSMLESGQPRLLPIIGPSGSGKSSVVMAGLLPRLRGNAVPDSQQWVYLPPMTPGGDPLENLTLALQRALPENSIRTIGDDLSAPSARGLHLLTRQIADAKQTRVLLFLDQFEELFTQTSDENLRAQFINLLVTAVTEPKGPLIVILTLRADFYDRPMFYADFGKLIEANGKSVLPMSLADLYAILRKPVSLPDVQLTFDERLISELVFEVRDQSGGLPLLQFTLTQLFERREGRSLTYAAYETIGGLWGALTKHAEKTYLNLPSDAHRDTCKSLFIRLIELGTTNQDTTRRRTSLSEMVTPDLEQTKRFQEVIAAFTEARLLTTDVIAGTPVVEVSHEALIREWSRLAEWIHNAREDIQLQQTISNDTQEWIRYKEREDDLYRGIKLAQAQDWAARSTPSAQEIAFIDAAQRFEQSRHDAELEGKLSAAYEERLRIARDLHDSVSQTLFTANVLSESLVLRWQRNPEKDLRFAQELSALIRGAIAEMRARVMLFELRPQSQNINLQQVIQYLTQAAQARKAIEFTIEGTYEAGLPYEINHALFQISREIIDNIVKHTNATEATINLDIQPNSVELRISDNGQGFDPAQISNGQGIQNMRERAKALGGTMQIESAIGQGTTIIVRVPHQMKQP
jgi:signal transduction histidine kinase